MKAEEIARRAADLVGGDRARQHGDKHETHRNIARLWSAWLRHPVSAADVAAMMVLLKLARTKGGSLNTDNFVDMAGYASIMGELADGADS